MKLKDFLKKISDDDGPIQSLASDEIEQMNKFDFYELMRDIETERHAGFVLGCVISLALTAALLFIQSR